MVRSEENLTSTDNMNYHYKKSQQKQFGVEKRKHLRQKLCVSVFLNLFVNCDFWIKKMKIEITDRDWF